MALAECLQNAGMETNRIQSGVPYTLNQLSQANHRHSWVDTTSGSVAGMSRASLADISSSYNDVDSVNSSPIMPRKPITVELNFDAMKRTLAEPTEASKREAKERQQQLVKTFRDANFDDLVRRTEPKHELIQNRLNDLFTALAVERQINQVENKSQAAGGGGGVQLKDRPIYENHFPELFYY